MAKKSTNTGTFIEIKADLIKNIKEYCEFNDLKLTDFINELLQKSFMVEKYGEAPPFLIKERAKTVSEPKEEIISEENRPEPIEKEEETKIVKKKIKRY